MSHEQPTPQHIYHRPQQYVTVPQQQHVYTNGGGALGLTEARPVRQSSTIINYGYKHPPNAVPPRVHPPNTPTDNINVQAPIQHIYQGPPIAAPPADVSGPSGEQHFYTDDPRHFRPHAIPPGIPQTLLKTKQETREVQIFEVSAEALRAEAAHSNMKHLLSDDLDLPSLDGEDLINGERDSFENQEGPVNMGSDCVVREAKQSPLLVNAKQYHRIIKRREQRARLQRLGLVPKVRKKYLHESRHRHAMMRNRSDGGRFNTGSTKTKLQALKNCEERQRSKAPTSPAPHPQQLWDQPMHATYLTNEQ